jgi:hypothetical protein
MLKALWREQWRKMDGESNNAENVGGNFFRLILMFGLLEFSLYMLLKMSIFYKVVKIGPDRPVRPVEPDLHPVRLVRKTIPRGNRDQTGKTGDPVGLEV